MSENKNNNVKEEIKKEADVKEELKVSGIEIEDEENVSAFDDEEDKNSRSISQTEKLFITKYPVQTIQRDVRGITVDNYAIAFLVSIGGQKVRNVLRIKTNNKGGENLRSLMKVVMASPGAHNLEILKRTFKNNASGDTTTVYSMQVREDK